MKLALYVVLGLSCLGDLVLGAWASTAWESFSDFWFKGAGDIVLQDVPRLLGLVLGLALLFFAAIQLLAIRWIRAEKEEGFRLAIAFGIYLVVSSLITFALFRRTDFLLVDGLRGALLTTVGYLAMAAPSVVRELRLPEKKVATGSRRDPRRDRESGPSRSYSGADRGQRQRGGPKPGGRDRDRGGRNRIDRDRGGRDRPRREDDREGRNVRDRESRPRREPAVPVTSPDLPGRRPSRDVRDAPDRARRVTQDLGPPVGEPSGLEVENRSRSAAEIVDSDSGNNRSLAVVVRGDFKGSRPAGPPGSEAEDAAGGRRRRRRRRGRKPSEIASDGSASLGAAETESDFEVDLVESPGALLEERFSSSRRPDQDRDRSREVGQRDYLNETADLLDNEGVRSSSPERAFDFGSEAPARSEAADKSADNPRNTSGNRPPPDLSVAEEISERRSHDSMKTDPVTMEFGRTRKPIRKRGGGPSQPHPRPPSGDNVPGAITPTPQGSSSRAVPLTGSEPRIGPVSDEELIQRPTRPSRDAEEAGVREGSERED